MCQMALLLIIYLFIIIESFNLNQLVSEPTHNHGHTLDLVFTFRLDIHHVTVQDLPMSDK